MKIWCVLGVVLLVACADAERSPTVSAGGRDAAACKDEDGDGFGQDCFIGNDCDDDDPEIHVGCKACVRPSEGCACDDSHQPVSCYLEPTAGEDGTLMCHEGTRYCREGLWSGCESIFSYPKPAATQSQAVVNPDAGTEKCSDCRANCFIVRDNLNPLDGGLGGNGSNTQVSDGGGLSLGTYITDAGMTDTGPAYDAATCIIGTAPDKDCDGVLDEYDPYPTEKPFATANPTIFLDLAPGATGTGAIDLAFNLNSIDVYFLIDQTTTMDGERDNLVETLTEGDFVNDPSFDCADYDFDHQPNNELKNMGIIGAIRCYIRDANFGIGFFRELPFSAYADSTDIAYRNLQDITNDLDALANAAEQLEPRANSDFEEVGMPALHSVVTGDGMYFGTDRTSVPERSGCPENTWGYPCFRADSIPIVLMFTDAPSHNGPGPSLYRAYDSSDLRIASANTAQKVLMGNGNETFTNATDAGDVTNSYVSYAGNTTGMATDTPAAAFSCSSAQSPDAFYEFTLSEQKSVTITTRGSNFDTVLGLWSGAPTLVTGLPAYPNTNDLPSAPYDFGYVENKYVQASGNNSGAGLNSDFLAADLGCSAYSGSKDVAFKFTLSESTRVALDTSGSTIGTSLSLFSGTPTPPAYATVTNTNDDYGSALDAGVIDGQLKAYSGSTDAKGITANFTGSQTGCNPADNAPDALYQFTVGGSTDRTVRITAEDSTLDTVLALTDNGGTTIATAKGHYDDNDSESDDPAILGALDGKAYRISGDVNWWMDNDYGSIGCSSNSDQRDAVYQFTLAGTRTVHIDTNSADTEFDTVLGLYKGSVGNTTTTNVTGMTTYEDEASSYYLNSVSGKKVVVSGSTTSSMRADYSASQTGTCGAHSDSPDAVYKMRFDSPTRVRLDTLGSSFDTVVSLHRELPDKVTVLPISGGDEISAPYFIADGVSNRNIRLENNNASTNDFLPHAVVDTAGCSAHDVASDAIVSFSVATSGDYELNTIGSSFDTVLGVFQGAPPSHPVAENKTTEGDTPGTAVNVGNIDGAWKTYYGTSASANDSLNTTSCSSNNSGRDVLYRFRVVTPRAVRIDTAGSTYNSSLLLYSGNADGTGLTSVACNDTGVSTGSVYYGDIITTGTLSAGYYFVALKGKSNNGGGPYRLSIKDITSPPSAAAPLFCNDDGGGSGSSKIATAALTAGQTYYAVIKGKAVTNRGAYKLAIKHLNWMSTFTPLACGSTSGSAIEYDIPSAGDYYAVLKGKTATSYGNYKLNITDLTVRPNGFISCNNDTYGTHSSITETLGAGTYWVVIKGRYSGSSGRGDYVINMYDTAVAPTNVLMCDYNSGSGGTSELQTSLSPGTYRVIVKGKGSGEKNNYKLQIRDVTGLPLGSGRLACDHNSGAGGRSYFEATLDPGTYTAVLKGNSGTNGDYKLSIRDASRLGAENSMACDDNGAGSSLSSLTRTLDPGTYYVGVRGKSTTGTGYYQVHFGGGSTTTNKYHVPKTYVDTVKALNAKNVHVIPILSCYNDTSKYSTYVRADCPNARDQYELLASATETVDADGVPLVFDMSSDGSGLSNTVVDAVQSLAQYLEMDVGVRVVFAPDANPGFEMSIRAVDVAGDGCRAPIDSEHQDCIPGATPRFEIEFTNPLDAPVPRNSAVNDPNGGYNFRAELIANDTFIVDQVPIYIIPETVVNVPPPPQVHASGTYWQTLSGNGCENRTDLPDWSELSWNATVPNGTTVTFAACTADTAEAAATCAPAPICTITGGAACSMTTPCPAGSFCSVGGNCHRITGGACSTSDDCWGSATCQSGVCVYNSQPIDVGEALGAQNFQSNLRVQVGLTANTQSNIGPTVHDWSINYLCKSSL